MYLRDLRASLQRRWYLVLTGLVLTGGLFLLVLRLVPATYQVQASILLLPPTSSTGDQGNPYLYLGGLGQAVDVLVRSVDSDTARKPIEDANPGTTYDVQPDATTSGPILVVIVMGKNEVVTLSVLDKVLADVPARLKVLQNQLAVPNGSQITSMGLATDVRAMKVTKNTTRAAVAVVAVGLGGTIILTGLVDGLLVSRRNRRAADPESAVETVTGARDPDLSKPSRRDESNPGHAVVHDAPPGPGLNPARLILGTRKRTTRLAVSNQAVQESRVNGAASSAPADGIR